jgi:catecholate siderophore receptor
MRIRIKRKKNTGRGKAPWAGPYRWVALGTLAAYGSVGDAWLAPAQNAPQSKAALPTRRFEISAGPLETVLDAFATASGLQVQFMQDGIRAVQSPGVSGIYTPEQALRKLLAGTGVTFHFASEDKVAVDLATVTGSVDVTARVEALQTSSPKYAGPLLDTPQTITEVSRQVMDEQGTTTLRDALRNVAGISLAAGEGGAQGDNLTIRGFSARNDLFIDGMRDFGSYYRDPFNLQEVEVLQGPSSVTFGRGSTGGVVNQATKTPGMDRFISGDIDFGTDLTRRGTLDFNMPIPKFGEGAAFRLNVMGNENNLAGRNVAENRRYGFAPSLALGLGTATRWTFSFVHEQANDIPDYGIPWLFNGPAPVNRNNYYGFKNGNYLRTYDDIGTAKVEHDVNRNVTIRDQIRYANYVREARITEAQLATPFTISTPLSALTVNRNEITVDSVESYLDEQLDVTAKFNTGSIRHNVVSGIELSRETSDPTRPKYTNVPTTSLLDPDPDQTFAGTATISTQVTTTSLSAAAYVLDTVNLGNHWEATGGFRWDYFDTDYKQFIAPAAAFTRIDRMPTWRGALVYKPVQAGSVYIAAGTSFNPSAESLSLSASNANLPPEKNETYEAGSKWDLHGGKATVRGALFRTEKTNVREPDPNNSLLNVLAGNQRVDGVQVELRTPLTSRWDMQTSYAYLDAKVVSSKYYPASVGARLANVPANTLTFWSEYRLGRGNEFGGGGNFVSSRTASSTVPLDPTTGLVKEVPSYWVFNAMAKHRLAEHLDVQVNVNNIANRYYYDQLHPAHIILGAGRSALVGLKFKF